MWSSGRPANDILTLGVTMAIKPIKTKTRSKLHEYHFDAGDSHDDTIGFCAVVVACSKREAVEILVAAMDARGLEAGLPVEFYDDQGERTDHEGRTDPGVQYLSVYFNAGNIDERYIDDIDDIPVVVTPLQGLVIAAKVVQMTKATRTWLMENDPQALVQLDAAISKAETA